MGAVAPPRGAFGPRRSEPAGSRSRAPTVRPATALRSGGTLHYGDRRRFRSEGRGGHDEEEADRGRAAARGDQRRGGAREVDPPRPPLDLASLVGAPAARRGARGDLRPDGGRSLGRARGVPDRGGAGAGTGAPVPADRAARALGGDDRRGRARGSAGGDPPVLATGLCRQRPPPARRGAVRPRPAAGLLRPVRGRRLPAARGAAARPRSARFRPQPGGGADLQGDDRDPAQVRRQAAGEPGGEE